MPHAGWFNPVYPMRTYRSFVIAALLLAALPVVMKAQWTWVGNTGTNWVTDPTNWSPTGVDLNNTSTTLTFGTSGVYTGPEPYLTNGTYQIGTLNITETTGGSIFSGNGTGAINATSGLIDGLNIAHAINYNTNVPIVLAGPINLGSGATIGGNGTAFLALGTSNGPSQPNGYIASNGPITMNGSGFELRIDGNATHLGDVNLNNGMLAVTPSGTNFQSNVASNPSILTQFTINTNTTYIYNGVMSGAGQFVKNGLGTVTMNGTNSYAGATIVAQGTLIVGVDNALPHTVLSIHPDTVITNPDLSTTVINTTLDVAGDYAIDHFSGSNFFGHIILEPGKLLVVSPASSSTTSTYAGTISGDGALVINGAAGSKTRLPNASTYVGGTTVNGGQLGIYNASGSALGTGAVTVNSGARLEGSGSFTGALTLNSGAAVVPDHMLTVGATTFNGGASYFWGLGNATGTAGIDNGLLSISGALTLSASSSPGNQITIDAVTLSGGIPGGSAANFDPFATYSWNLTTGASSLLGTFAANDFTVDTSSFQNAFGNGVFSVGLSGDSHNLVLHYDAATAIPEPAAGAAIMGALALAGALWRPKKTSRA
jgi:autotransporter-associated beta strand protein